MDLIDIIYGDLSNCDLGIDLEKLQETNSNLQNHIHDLEDNVEKLCTTLTGMKTMHTNLKKNIVELQETAKTEIDQRNRTIIELQTILDEYMCSNGSNNIKSNNTTLKRLLPDNNNSLLEKQDNKRFKLDYREGYGKNRYQSGNNGGPKRSRSNSRDRYYKNNRLSLENYRYRYRNDDRRRYRQNDGYAKSKSIEKDKRILEPGEIVDDDINNRLGSNEGTIKLENESRRNNYRIGYRDHRQEFVFKSRQFREQQQRQNHETTTNIQSKPPPVFIPKFDDCFRLNNSPPSKKFKSHDESKDAIVPFIKSEKFNRNERQDKELKKKKLQLKRIETQKVKELDIKIPFPNDDREIVAENNMTDEQNVVECLNSILNFITKLENNERKINVKKEGEKEKNSEKIKAGISKENEEGRDEIILKKTEESKVDIISKKKSEKSKAEIFRKSEESKTEILKRGEKRKPEISKKTEEKGKVEVFRKGEECEAKISKQNEESNAEITKKNDECKVEIFKKGEKRKGEITKKSDESKDEISKASEKDKAEILRKGEESEAKVFRRDAEFKAKISKQNEESKAEITQKSNKSKDEISKENEKGKGEIVKRGEKSKPGISKKSEESKDEILKKSEESKEEILKKSEESRNEILRKSEKVKAEIFTRDEEFKAKISKQNEESKAEITQKSNESKDEISKESEKGKAEIFRKGGESETEISKQSEKGKAEILKRGERSKPEISKKSEKSRPKIFNKVEESKADEISKKTEDTNTKMPEENEDNSKVEISNQIEEKCKNLKSENILVLATKQNESDIKSKIQTKFSTIFTKRMENRQKIKEINSIKTEQKPIIDKENKNKKSDLLETSKKSCTELGIDTNYQKVAEDSGDKISQLNSILKKEEPGVKCLGVAADASEQKEKQQKGTEYNIKNIVENVECKLKDDQMELEIPNPNNTTEIIVTKQPSEVVNNISRLVVDLDSKLKSSPMKNVEKIIEEVATNVKTSHLKEDSEKSEKNIQVVSKDEKKSNLDKVETNLILEESKKDEQKINDKILVENITSKVEEKLTKPNLAFSSDLNSLENKVIINKEQEENKKILKVPNNKTTKSSPVINKCVANASSVGPNKQLKIVIEELKYSKQQQTINLKQLEGKKSILNEINETPKIKSNKKNDAQYNYKKQIIKKLEETGDTKTNTSNNKFLEDIDNKTRTESNLKNEVAATADMKKETPKTGRVLRSMVNKKPRKIYVEHQSSTESAVSSENINKSLNLSTCSIPTLDLNLQSDKTSLISDQEPSSIPALHLNTEKKVDDTNNKLNEFITTSTPNQSNFNITDSKLAQLREDLSTSSSDLSHKDSEKGDDSNLTVVSDKSQVIRRRPRCIMVMKD